MAARPVSSWAAVVASLGSGARWSRAVCRGVGAEGHHAPRFAALVEGVVGLQGELCQHRHGPLQPAKARHPQGKPSLRQQGQGHPPR